MHQTPVTRRTLLGGVGLSALAAATWGSAPAFATSEGTVLPLVEALPGGAPDRTLFAAHEQVFASYLLIVAPLANSVIDDDPELFGWMEDGWWRTPNQPYNARIMEHVATLSWFLTHERPWNPYYLDDDLAGRLDAALQYYLGIQQEGGYWTEYGWASESRAATGFGAVALSATLRDLLKADLLPDRRAELETALRSACAWLVDLDSYFWETPIQGSNQTAALLAGVAQTAEVLEDPSIAAEVADRCAFLLEHGQAPAGFFHEPLGYDAGYNFTVQLPDMGHIYEETGDASMVEMARRWAEWAGYAIVLEPGQVRGFHIAGFSARNAVSGFETPVRDDADRSALGRVFLPEVPELAAFFATAQEKQQSRVDWAASTAPVQPRAKQDTSPRLYMHVPVAPDGVTAAERDAQIAQLPYVAEDAFTQARLGTLDQQYVFVRRPAYYTAALYGVHASERQRTGTDLLWHPEAGTLVLSLNNTAGDYWATISDSGDSGTEDVEVTHHAGEDATGAVIAPEELTGFEGVFTSRYVTVGSSIATGVSHWPDGIRRSVTAAGAAVENVPLVLAPDDDVVFSDGTPAPFDTTTTATASGLTVTRGGTSLVVSWGASADVELATTTRTFLGATRRHHVLTIPFTDALITELTLVDVADAAAGRVDFSVASQTVRRDGRFRTAVHVVNLDTETVDIRVATSAGTRTFRELAPGAGGYVEFRNARLLPAPGLAVATTCGGGKPRVATRTFEV